MDGYGQSGIGTLTGQDLAGSRPRRRPVSALRARLVARWTTRRHARQLVPSHGPDVLSDREKAWSFVMAAGTGAGWMGPTIGLHRLGHEAGHDEG